MSPLPVKILRPGAGTCLLTGFCLLEKRFVDVAIRYSTPPVTVDRWTKILEIKEMFDSKTNGSI